MILTQPVALGGVSVLVCGRADDSAFHQGPHPLSHYLLIAALRAGGPFRQIIDVGANLGLTVALAAKLAPDASIMAIEPAARAFECLQQTIAVNALERRVRAIRALVSSKAQTLTFQEMADRSTHSMITNGDGAVMEARPLDSIADGLEDVDLVKIDTEGHDSEVIRGMTRIDQAHRPIIIAEISKDRCDAALDELLESYGQFLYMPNLWQRVHVASTARALAKAVARTKERGYSDVLICRNEPRFAEVAKAIAGPAMIPIRPVPRTFKNLYRFLTKRLPG